MFRRNVTGFGSGIVCIEYRRGEGGHNLQRLNGSAARKAEYAFRLLMPAIEYSQWWCGCTHFKASAMPETIRARLTSLWNCRSLSFWNTCKPSQAPATPGSA